MQFEIAASYMPFVYSGFMSARAIHWIRVCLVSLLLTVLISLSAGMLYEGISSAADARRFPQIGASYNIGGRKMSLYCSGQGSTTVILESGLGSPGYSWFQVQPKVSEWTRVCAADRAGYGWSDPAGTRRDTTTIARELHALLAAARVPPPYIFVGHSFGGFTARVFNGMYPGEVAAVVLVDASHPDQAKYLPPELVRVDVRQAAKFRYVPVAINIGLVRLMRKFNALSTVPAKLPQASRDILEYLIYQPKFFRAALGELDLFDTESAQAVRAAGTFGDKPLVVITAGKSYVENDYGFQKIWVGKLQPELVKLSSRGRQVFLPESTHMIPYDRPDAIIQAVGELLGR